MQYLITFHSNFDASSFMKQAKTLGTARMKPVPRKLSSSCGTCVLFTPTNGDKVPDVLFEKSFEKFYLITDEHYELLKEKE